MSAEIQPFEFRDQPVRVALVEGEPWFVLADLCRVLGIGSNSAVTDVKKRLDQSTLDSTKVVNAAGFARDTDIVSESGMYEVVIRSDKPEAVMFRRWITGEVLPQIRKTGGYQVKQQIELPSMKQLAQMVIDSEEAREASEKQLALETKARIAIESYAKDLEPRAEFYDRFMDGSGTYSIGAVAKMLGIGQNKLFEELRSFGVLMSGGINHNSPYQKYMHHFHIVAREYERGDGSRGNTFTTRVKPSGIDFIARKTGRTVISPPAVEVA